MTTANIKFVQDIYAAFGRGDVAAVVDACAPDVTWGLVGSPDDIPMAGIRSGRAGVGEFFRSLKETQQLTAFRPMTFADSGDTVFVLGNAEWIMNRNGVSGSNDWVHVITIRGGKVISYRGHQDTALLSHAYHAAPGAKGKVA